MSRRGRHPHNRLTVAVVNRARPGRHADGNGLYLVVRPSLARSWIQRVTINKQRTDLGLGPYPLVSLANARRVAIENLLTLRDGGDPRVKAAPTEGPTSPTFRETYDLVTDNRRSNWKRATTEASWRRGFEKYVLPAIGEKPMSSISLRNVRDIVHPHWFGRNSTGYLLRQNLEAVFDWAVAANYRVDNPAANLRRLLPKRRSNVRHRPSLPHDQAREALAEWQELPVKEPVKLVVLFIVLTAARLSEATGATWGEIDFSRKRWQVPAERMKSGSGHTVPLSIQALEVLRRARALKGDGSLVFPVVGRNGKVRCGSQDMVADALRKLNRLDEKKQRIVVHGFRATFRGWTIEIEGALREVAEAALAHGESDGHGEVVHPRRGSFRFSNRADAALGGLRSPSVGELRRRLVASVFSVRFRTGAFPISRSSV